MYRAVHTGKLCSELPIGTGPTQYYCARNSDPAGTLTVTAGGVISLKKEYIRLGGRVIAVEQTQ